MCLKKGAYTHCRDRGGSLHFHCTLCVRFLSMQSAGPSQHLCTQVLSLDPACCLGGTGDPNSTGELLWLMQNQPWGPCAESSTNRVFSVRRPAGVKKEKRRSPPPPRVSSPGVCLWWRGGKQSPSSGAN